MKIEVPTQEVLSGGVQSVKKFTIKAGAHMMQVLSRLYKDPIDAMVREYMTNMHDAYVALRRKNPNAQIIPPILQLPTMLESTLIFKDFGVGMSKDTVLEVYTQYGNSTKNDSNDEVGGFGLGSKTAFAYNGGVSWSVESRYEGEKHIFMAYMGEDNVPTLAHVSSEPTTEPSGITIKIPIKRGDDARCYNAARRYVPFFPMDIDVRGDEQQKVERELPYAVRGKKWGIRTTGHARSSITVIMGNVPYMVDWTALLGGDRYGYNRDLNRLGLTPSHQNFLSYNAVDLFVDIGAVNIVPSRDDLEYTDRTKDAIKAAFAEMWPELVTVISGEMASAKTEWDAIQRFRNFQSIPQIKSVVTEFVWKGKKLSITDGITRPSSVLTQMDKDISIVELSVSSERGVPTVNSDVKEIKIGSENPENIVKRRHHSYGHETQYVTFVIIDDLPKGGSMISKAMMYDRLVYRAASGRVSSYGHTPGNCYVLTTALTEQQISEALGGYPAAQIHRTSALKGTVNIPSQLKSPKDTVYKWHSGTWRARANMPDDTETVYYVVLKREPYSKRWTYEGEHTNTARSNVVSLLETGVTLGVTSYPLYGVKEDELDRIKDKTNWISLPDVVAAEAEKQIGKYVEDIAYSQANLNAVSQFYVKMAELNSEIRKMPYFAELYALNKRIEKIDQYTMSNMRVRFHHVGLGDKLNEAIKKVDVPNVNNLVAQIRDKYPMLHFAEAVYTREDYSSGIGAGRVKIAMALDYMKEIG